MVASVQNPADECNNALVRIGWKQSIGSLYDGSEAAKVLLDIYGQTRDFLLRLDDWGFAERQINAVLLKSAPPGGYIPPNTWTPAYPPQGWLFEYEYPTDCLKVRSMRIPSLFVPNFDPQPQAFTDYNDDTYVPSQKTILTNAVDAILTYTGRITDPTTWNASFCEALAAALARRISPALAGPEAAKMEAADEQVETASAEMIQG